MSTPIHGANGTATSSRASSAAVVNQSERINGWTCPWHPLQFVAWVFLIFFSISYFGVHVFYLPREWRAAGFIIPGGLCAIHLIYHLFALTIDPADRNIRGGPKKDKAFFDRNQHQHVIENYHCYICQADVGPKSKHCSVCNKCVSDFDHHCKWLNNCVGGRNYRLFIGCISSAFVLAVIVFGVTLYAFIVFFDDRDHLKSLTGGKFEMLNVPINDDKVFIIFTGIVGALLLLAIALLGHLLGFHIYLICHKMSTYDFIVSSRERRSDNIDVEAGHNKSPPSRKLFKNQVKPEEDRKQSLGNEQIELTDNARSDGSQENLCNEPTVKIINEVSSKAAAKQSRPSIDQENFRDRRPYALNSLPVGSSAVGQYSPRGVTEPSSSEESLKEITPYPPRVVLQAPHDINIASTSKPHHLDTQYGADTSSPRPGTSWEKSDDDGEELLPSPRGKRPRKRGPSGGGSPSNAATNGAGCVDTEAQNRNVGDAPKSNEQCAVESSVPAKRLKRQLKRPTTATLPPLVNANKRRPLPPLRPEDYDADAK